MLSNHTVEGAREVGDADPSEGGAVHAHVGPSSLPQSREGGVDVPHVGLGVTDPVVLDHAAR